MRRAESAERGNLKQSQVVSAKHEPRKGTYASGGLAQSKKLNLDDLDVVMLRKFMKGHPVELMLRKPAKLMASELDVDEATVRSHLKRWQESGFLVYWAATVSPGLLGQRQCSVRVELPAGSHKSEVLKKLRLAEGVFRIRDYLGEAVTVDIFFEEPGDLEKRVLLVQALAQTLKCVRIGVAVFPTPRASLDEIDLMILGVLGWAARKPHVSVARETGISAKTVRRRLEKMAENQNIGMGLFLDYRRLTGKLIADLTILCKSAEKTETDRRVISIAGERMLTPEFHAEEASVLRLMLDNVSEQREIIEAVNGLEGVKSAWLDILVEDNFVAETFYALERRMLDRVAAKRTLRPITYHLWEESWKVSTSEIYPDIQVR